MGFSERREFQIWNFPPPRGVHPARSKRRMDDVRPRRDGLHPSQCGRRWHALTAGGSTPLTTEAKPGRVGMFRARAHAHPPTPPGRPRREGMPPAPLLVRGAHQARSSPSTLLRAKDSVVKRGPMAAGSQRAAHGRRTGDRGQALFSAKDAEKRASPLGKKSQSPGPLRPSSDEATGAAVCEVGQSNLLGGRA